MNIENTFNPGNPDSTEKIVNAENINKKRYLYIKWYFRVIRWCFILILFLTLPFHYIPERRMIFPKESLTFSNTIITEKDITDVIEKYNNAETVWEKMSIAQTPLARRLFEIGVIRKDKQKK